VTVWGNPLSRSLLRAKRTFMSRLCMSRLLP